MSSYFFSFICGWCLCCCLVKWYTFYLIRLLSMCNFNYHWICCPCVFISAAEISAIKHRFKMYVRVCVCVRTHARPQILSAFILTCCLSGDKIDSNKKKKKGNRKKLIIIGLIHSMKDNDIKLSFAYYQLHFDQCNIDEDHFTNVV